VCDEHRIVGKREETAHRELDARSSSKHPVAEPCQRCDGRAERLTRIDESLELLLDFQIAYADSPDFADPRLSHAKTGCLKIDDDVRGRFEGELCAGRVGESYRIAVPPEPRVVSDDVAQERPRNPDGRLPQRKQVARRLLGEDGSAPFFHEFDKAIGCVQPELH
jgi:hypothetical protein